jgi:hypothetical protein
MNPQIAPRFVSWVSLALVLLPCLFSFAGLLSLSAVQLLALVGTAGWFISTPVWMSRPAEDKTDGATI